MNIETQKSMKIEQLLNELFMKGGLSYNSKGEKPVTGYMVSVKDMFVRQGMIISASELKALESELTESNLFLGGWFNQDNGRTYWDISINLDNLENARNLGAINKQLSIYDVKNETTINLGWEKTNY